MANETDTPCDTDGAAHRFSEVRIVDPVGGVGAQVQDFVAQPAQLLGQSLLEVEACVVRADGDPGHGADATGRRVPSRRPWPRRLA